VEALDAPIRETALPLIEAAPSWEFVFGYADTVMPAVAGFILVPAKVVVVVV